MQTGPLRRGTPSPCVSVMSIKLAPDVTPLQSGLIVQVYHEGIEYLYIVESTNFVIALATKRTARERERPERKSKTQISNRANI